MVIETRVQVRFNDFLYSDELDMLHRLQFFDLTLSEEFWFL